ncbi:hypothetical protein QAD02_007402 [Eretmocerus hayati]|uniref:Uncharacterized protein n=1 Tax=Eretmocerus hayati TaxID=131215 RepID=A0ACC2N3I7_9HYME|nr:hypothetical protein QAD02_007402 [Eretmocerus hayati]
MAAVKSTSPWDDSGTVRMNGTTIPDSNIVDLVNLAVRWRKSYSARKYGRISRHFSDSAVTPSNLADPPQSGDGKEADNVEDCSEVFNETADSTFGCSTPGTKKKKPSWATLTLNK